VTLLIISDTDVVYLDVLCMPTGEELRRTEDSYNEAQKKWIDDMITACQVSHTCSI